MTPRRQPEKTVQSQIVALLRSLGGTVWITGTRRPKGESQSTRMTPGLPDLLCFVRGRFVFVEVKARGGRLTPEQQHFRACCQATGTAHVVGDLDAVIAWLVSEGLLSRESLSAERQARLEVMPCSGG